MNGKQFRAAIYDKDKVLKGYINAEGNIVHVPEGTEYVRISDRPHVSVTSDRIKITTQPLEVQRSGNNRNLPCPCGSGRKFKKCCFYLDNPVHILP